LDRPVRTAIDHRDLVAQAIGHIDHVRHRIARPAHGPLSAGTVAATVFVRPSITDTLFAWVRLIATACHG
jgi:hypothetical protein